MQAVVLATESEQNMGPLTDSSTVHGLPVGTETMVEGIVNKLFSIDVTNITLNIDNSAVKSIFGAERGVDRIEDDDTSIRFSGPRDDMTAGLDPDEPFLCVRADMVYDESSLEALAEEDTAFGYVTESSDLREYTQGDVTVDQGSVTDIAAGDYGYNGEFGVYAYKFPASAHEWNYGLDPMATELAHTGDPTAVEVSEWYPIQTPHQLLEAQPQEEPFIHPDADVVGKVVGSSYVGPDVTVKSGAVVQDSVLCEGATVGHGSFVGSSVVGTWVDVDENVTVKHRSTSDSTITYTVGDERLDSGRKSFGAVIGPRAQITGGSVTDTGAIFDSGTVVQ